MPMMVMNSLWSGDAVSNLLDYEGYHATNCLRNGESSDSVNDSLKSFLVNLASDKIPLAK